MTLREYAKLMNDTALQGSLSNEEYNRLYKPLLDGIQSMIPPMLFRYRSCNELSLQALWDDKIWLSKGNVMNDDYVPILNFIALMIPFAQNTDGSFIAASTRVVKLYAKTCSEQLIETYQTIYVTSHNGI